MLLLHAVCGDVCSRLCSQAEHRRRQALVQLTCKSRAVVKEVAFRGSRVQQQGPARMFQG